MKRNNFKKQTHKATTFKCILCVLLASMFYSLIARSQSIETCGLKTKKKCTDAKVQKKTELKIKSMPLIKATVAPKNTNVESVVKSQKKIMKKTPVKTIKVNVQEAFLIKKLDEAYTKSSSMQANFVQSYSSGLNETSVKGKVYIERPGKMKWEYDTPKGKFFLADGKNLSLYDPNFKQVMQSEQVNDSQAPIALALLFGQKKASSMFNVKILENKKDTVSMKLTPKEVVPNVDFVEMTLKKGKLYSIIETKVMDAFGGENIMSFSNIKNNQKIASNIFVFKKPKGAKIVKTEGMRF